MTTDFSANRPNESPDIGMFTGWKRIHHRHLFCISSLRMDGTCEVTLNYYFYCMETDTIVKSYFTYKGSK
jgi:hypothetical protein